MKEKTGTIYMPEISTKNTHTSCSSLNVRNQILSAYKTTHKIKPLHNADKRF
jgi:hypothetical protein